jgi:hypothetical protein
MKKDYLEDRFSHSHLYCFNPKNHTIICIFLIPKITPLSSPWETNTSSTSQKIPCILWNPKVHYWSWDIVVSVVTHYGLDDPGFESRQQQEISVFSKISRPALKPAQNPIEWVLELFPGGKAAGAWSLPLTSI